MGRFKTKVITDEAQVPKGFVRIASVADSLADQKRLSDAHSDGLLEAVKLMRSIDDKHGPVWVDARAAESFLQDSSNPKAAKPLSASLTPEHFQAAITALCEISNGIAVLCDEVRRLRTDMAAAVELLAKQPKTAQQELVSTFESNGFHQ